MVKAQESWLYCQHSAWQLPDLNCMSTSLDPRQPECLPSFINSGNYMFSANAALPGIASPGLAKLKTEPTNGPHKLLQILPPRFQNLVPSPYPYLNEKQPAVPCGFRGLAAPIEAAPLQKSLLVFDKSGNQTRLIYNSVCPSVLNPPATLKKLVSENGFLQKAIKTIDQFTSMKPVFDKEFDENHSSGKGCEMHEDTEEINALLYSDGDDDYSGDDDDDDDDEVKSTGHSPVAIGGNYGKHELTLDMPEEFASSDGPIKRQKMLDGGYNKSSQTDTACSVQLEGSHECDNDAESSYANCWTQKVLDNKLSRKDDIHKTLRILQGIIPGVNGKDPLSVLDESIDYLQSLKLKAVALGSVATIKLHL